MLVNARVSSSGDITIMGRLVKSPSQTIRFWSLYFGMFVNNHFEPKESFGGTIWELDTT